VTNQNPPGQISMNHLISPHGQDSLDTCWPVACRAARRTLAGQPQRRMGRPSPRSPAACDDDDR